MERIRTGRHCVFMLHAHLIFITKYRGRIFEGVHLAKMEEIMRGVCVQFEVDLVEFNGEQDHIHMLINFPPKVAISKLVNSLKGVSSRKMKLHFPELHKPAWKNDALWSPSYFAGSVGGAPLEVLKRYIEQQNRPH
ncbi:IS200/IS605 family transposase [Providencia burhodogranariea]|uniref:Transposase, IS200 family protein n=1 Tax=Providencia burhodogranariea DSM 19968 TaxID=1141662 RepID=K8W0R7_9GAMM|nr:IS200/IS605 family transposase [Providencia burhodogranariea]EKT54143.1 transposase, IS200 family protein [Providencia burhodogranariea DSM 19968]